MVKVRKGSQRGLTKVTKSGRRRAKKQSHQLSGRLSKSQVQAPGVVRENWNEALSRVQNMRAMGLTAYVNAMPKKAGTETTVVMELKRVAACGEAKAAPRAAPGEIAFVKRAVAKYGYDYKAIARDIKINYFQWTPAQVRRKFDTVAAIGKIDMAPKDDDTAVE